MKKYLSFGILALAWLLFPAGSCSGSGEPDSPVINPGGGSLNSTGNVGGSITVAISQDLDQSLDPHTATSAGKREIFFNIFEGLVKADPDGNFIPALAEAVREAVLAGLMSVKDPEIASEQCLLLLYACLADVGLGLLSVEDGNVYRQSA